MARPGGRTAAARFDTAVGGGGYAWWYIDALSDDGESALTVIAFVGSVFSPFYAAARRRDAAADPQAFCALNVALYGPPDAWALTEWPQARCSRDADGFTLGTSQLQWRGDTLALDIRERTAPLRRPLRGRVLLHPQALATHRVRLDAAGAHQWRPIAPCARVEVEFTQPALRWQGHAYIDSNTGSRGLEADFLHWDWLRAPLPGGRTAVVYDGWRSDGTPFSIAQAFAPDGSIEALAPPPAVTLPASAWGVARGTRCEAGGRAAVVKRLEDGPFYARSLLGTRLAGADVVGVHESLSLERFRQRWVQWLLPFRMAGLRHAFGPRAAHGAAGGAP